MRLRIVPPIATVYPNGRQTFTPEAEPPPAMWWAVDSSGDIKSDFSLEVDAAQSSVLGNGAHQLVSGLGIVELTIDDQCRPTSSNQLVIGGFIFDVSGFRYDYLLKINSTVVEVRDETNTQLYTESYSTVSGDVYRLELNAGFRFYRNGVLKHSRVGLSTDIVYPQLYQCSITEDTAAAPTRIPAPRLIGNWKLRPVVTWTAPSHGFISPTGMAGETEYFGGITPGTYTLTGQIEPASDAGGVQKATATIIIPPLEPLGPTEVTLAPSQKVRFKTNYPDELIVWSVFSGGGSVTQGEFTAAATPGTTIVRGTADVNGQVVSFTITVPAEITNTNNYAAAKASEQVDFNTNIAAVMAPQFVSAGSVVSGTGAVVVPLPATAEPNDILLLFVESANEAVSTPSGWTPVADSPQGTGTGGAAGSTRLTVFYARWTPGQSLSAPTVADPGDHVIARILAFRGGTTGGDPWDVTAGDTGSSSTSVSIPGDTTTVNNCLVMVIVANATDTATPQTSGFTNANLSGLNELVDNNAIDGVGGGFAVAVGEKTVAGAYGTTTATLATASAQGRMSIALKPGALTWTASIGSINSSSGLWTAPSLAGQTAKITVSNGIFTSTLEVPVLEVFPVEPSSPIKWERRKTVLVSTAEDRSRSSRVKDKGGAAFESWEITISNMELTELNSVLDFFDAHFPGKRFIFEDKLRSLRKVVYFDSNVSVEAASDCSVSVSFRVVEA